MRTAFINLGVVTGGYLVTWFSGRSLGWASPGSIAIVVAVLLASWRLHADGESWRSVGLHKPSGWGRLALSVVALYVAIAVGVVAVVTPIAKALDLPSLDLTVFADLRDNPHELARMLLIVWTTAAFGEEMLFRGFLLGQLRSLFGDGRLASSSAVVSQALAFGIAHLPLGIHGVMTATLVGIVFGVWYSVRGRNLWPLILAHGLTDTLSITAIYLGVLPA